MSSSCAETKKSESEEREREREREGFVCGVRTQTDSDGGFKPL
jgi:hypothetical protein